MTRGRIAVGLLVTAAVCVVGALLAGNPAPADPIPAGSLTTPLWSARRVPQAVVDGVAARHLQADLDAGFTGNDGCFSVTDDTGPIAADAVDQPFVGASTQKLLTALASIAALGPDARLTTKVVAPAAPTGGTAGRLVLSGGGDPTLSTQAFRDHQAADPKYDGVTYTSLEALADAVVAKGISRVGALAVDDSRLDATRWNPNWPASIRAEGAIGPIGALTVNRGFSAPTGTGATVDDPAVFAGEQFATLLRARGVTVDGRVTRVKAPDDDAVEIASVASAPMSDVVGGMLRSSDNLGAEVLVREIGRKTGAGGTTEAGTRAVLDTLARLGVPTVGLVMIDGSGLSHDDRVTCRALTAALDLAHRPEYASLLDGLPVAGRTGTLADEMLGTTLVGNLRGKTGFLDGVTGLVGVVDLGRPVRFAFVVDGAFGEGQAIRLRSRLAQLIGQYPRAPAADALVPAPDPPRPAA